MISRTLVLCGLLTFAVSLGNLVADLPPSSAPSLKPQRILSLNLCTDELLLELVPPERIAAVTRYLANPDNSLYYDHALGIPKIKGDPEEVLAYNPDLVIAGVFSNRDSLHMLKRLGIPNVVVGVGTNFDDIYANIRTVAKSVGEEAKGEALIERMKADLLRYSKENKVAKGKKPLRAVFYQSSGNVPGLNTFENSILEVAGMTNVAASLGRSGNFHLPLEELLLEKPDVIIFESQQKKRTSIGREMLFHPAMSKALPDVKTMIVPTKLLSCGSPAAVSAVELIVKSNRGQACNKSLSPMCHETISGEGLIHER